MRFKIVVRHPFLMRLLGPGVLRHHTRQQKPQAKEPALRVHQNTCVHPVVVTANDNKEQWKDCGLPVGAERPNGWLCPTHEALVFPTKKRETAKWAPR
jgi:hypothetical protein